MKTFSAILLVASLFSGIIAQDIPNCPSPVQPSCLMSKAQFTVYGTVLSNDREVPPNNATSYNAEVAIQCVYSSFSNPKSEVLRGGQTIRVTRWGNPHPRCRNAGGGGASAIPGESKFFFFYVASSSNAAGTSYGVFDVCTGGVPYTQENLQTLSNLLEKYPSNKILSGTNCTLPAGKAEDAPSIIPEDQSQPEEADASTLAVSAILGLGAVLFGLLL